MSNQPQDLSQTKEKKEDVRHRVIGTALTIILVVVIVFMAVAIYTFIQIKIIRKTYTHFAGVIALSEQTESMKPAINIDDIVFVSINNSGLKKDDIIAYYDNDYVITHRLISINNDSYITLGDNSDSGIEHVNKDQILGKVIYIWRFGTWKKTMTSPQVYILILITLMFGSFTILEFKKDEINKRRKDGEEKS